MMPTWAWFILGWFALTLIVGPLLGRHFKDPDPDWP